MTELPNPSYDQPTKKRARRLALEHAVKLVTSRRNDAAVVAADHPERVRDALLASEIRGEATAGEACEQSDLNSWKTLRAQAIGVRTPGDITVAYLAGPEPENDLDVLLELGLRPENIWAFEVDKKAVEQGLTTLRTAPYRGIKYVPASIEDYFISTPRRFDIVYFDACGPLPSRTSNTARVLATMFRQNALAPLGVLVSNFACPDVSSESELDRYAFLIGAYLYPKDFLESAKGGGIDEGARAHGFFFNPPPSEDYDEESCSPTANFHDAVKGDFERYYGMFITRALMDMASIVAPTARLVGGDLYKVAFNSDLANAVKRASRFVRFNQSALEAFQPDDDSNSNGEDTSATIGFDEDAEAPDPDGDAIIDPDLYSLLWTLAACGCFTPGPDFGAPPSNASKLLMDWRNMMAGKPASKPFHELVAIFYAWRHDETLWSDAMRRLANFPYRDRMQFFCDVPTIELGFYPAFAQLAYPAHANIRETRRFRYVAEGKRTSMFLDVIAFDECRYVYDWLSALHLTPEDWNDVSAQLTFRFALDGIAKELRWYGVDFLYGCHVVGVDADFTASELKPRENLSPKAT